MHRRLWNNIGNRMQWYRFRLLKRSRWIHYRFHTSSLSSHTFFLKLFIRIEVHKIPTWSVAKDSKRSCPHCLPGIQVQSHHTKSFVIRLQRLLVPYRIQFKILLHVHRALCLPEDASKFRVGPPLQSTLPSAIRSIRGVQSIKQALKTFLFRVAFAQWTNSRSCTVIAVYYFPFL